MLDGCSTLLCKNKKTIDKDQEDVTPTLAAAKEISNAGGRWDDSILSLLNSNHFM